MPTPYRKSVFYDETKRRLRAYQWITRPLFVVLICALAFTGWSVFQYVSLPIPNIQNLDRSRAATGAPSSALPVKTTPQRPDLLAAWQLEQMQKNVPTDQMPRRWGFFVNWDDNSFSSLRTNIDSLDGLMPEWLHLAGADGSIGIDDANRQAEVVQFLRDRGSNAQVVPLINNYRSDIQDWDGEMVATMLAHPEARLRVISSLLDFVRQNGFSGVSIDFENIPDEAQPNLLSFMKELSETFHREKLFVIQDIPLDDDSFQVKLFGRYADQIVLMAYDEHALGGDSAGSIAGQTWYEQALLTRLRELPANKYIIALGGYGYDWVDNASRGAEVSFQDAMRLARSVSAPITLDDSTLNPTFDYDAASGARHHVWYLDAVTAFNEIGFANKYHPSGFALWRLGAEDPRVWRVFDAARTGEERDSVVRMLESMPYGYDLDYEGRGEVVQVTGLPQTGLAEFVYDASSDRIVKESVQTYPSGYVITRYGGQDSKKIALTFDDGPDPNYTPKILSILEHYHVPATFFVVGVNASQNPELLTRIMDTGSDIGNHTFSHPDITRININQLRLELNALQRLVESVLHRNLLLFRPPYAEDIEPATPEQIAPLLDTSRLGYYTVAMHIDPNDWDQPGTSADTIVQRVVDAAKNGEGNIVLLHDGGGDRDQTVLALPRIIVELQRSGFQIVNVSTLLGVDRGSTMPPSTFSSRTISLLNALSFRLVDNFGDFLKLSFEAGISLGVGRLIFIITLALVQKRRSRLYRKRRFQENYQPSVGIIVPAYNEGRVIVQTLRSILQSHYPHFNITVVDDGSTDDTVEQVRRHFSGDSRIHVLTKENGGKASALNLGIAMTQADIIITLDADTQFTPDTVAYLVRHFADTTIGAVAGNAKVGNRVNILTRWQALEYIVSQNLDRRAFETFNAITVVPGSVGAWRREAILRVGGFSSRTLAEDADLTFGIIRMGYRVVYEDKALGFTEAPQTVSSFIRQRFRWMYGTIQTVYKHRLLCFNFKNGGGLGWLSIPNILVFQVVFPLISPFIDIALIGSLAWGALQYVQHPISYQASFGPLLDFYLLFTTIDIGVAMIAFLLESRREQISLILWLPFQRFFYRQLMYYVAFKTIISILKGNLVQWGQQDRRATVVFRQFAKNSDGPVS